MNKATLFLLLINVIILCMILEWYPTTDNFVEFILSAVMVGLLVVVDFAYIQEYMEDLV